MCYISPEGVVIGADSTSSVTLEGGFHYYNYNQKVLEIGDGGTLGLVTWGLGGLSGVSYRTVLAKLADNLQTNPAASVEDVANRWSQLLGPLYYSILASDIAECRALQAKAAFDAKAVPRPDMRDETEEQKFYGLSNGLYVGFCIAGYVLPDRVPEACSIGFDPLQTHPLVSKVAINTPFWGAPNMIRRLVFGCDPALAQDIMHSGKWSGTQVELDAILSQYALLHPMLPIRDAIDFVHACIHSTIKAFKFSSLSQICGGPIELAVITTDRPFRWVRHKEWDAAISEGLGT